MAHAHAHGRGVGRREQPHATPETLAARRDANRRRMLAAGINGGMFAVGVVGGIVTGSLALLADAGHVLSDLAAIGLGLLAARIASRAASPRRTFGYQRTEVIAALVNGLTLAAIAIVIV